MAECHTQGIGAVPEIGYTPNFISDKFLPLPDGFQTANWHDAAAAAPIMFPAATVEVHAVNPALNTVPRDEDS